MENKPVCYVKDRVIPEIYSGTPTFMGLPKLNDEKELRNYDIVFMGAPWEGICTWGSYSGCELATKSIRAASVRYGGYLPEFNLDVFDYFSGADYGDVAINSGNIEETLNNIETKAEEIINAGAFPVTFGGDHSVAYPIIKALAKKHNGKIGIIHLDSHFDNMDTFGDSKYARCSPLHRAYEIEGIDTKNIVHVGVRGPRNNPLGMKAINDTGATLITSFEIKEKGIDYVIEKSLEIAKKDTEAVYVTVCSDILDVAFNPGGPPDLCGLTSYELAKFLHVVASKGIDGFDFVEVYPPTDSNNVSSHAAVWMTLYTLSGLAKYKHFK
ncbi:agmatinase family protein [Anaeromicrobium sediminis]|uniref:Arginase n=1 Tax=Anaeromicrobium sediminis TaxID=1478221 RepID=A0A267MJR2_9FIRM|nr:agmatinase family protein [Anaeromicrobium sediminis]PAB59809.1 arginase [Anaeromicrobium sediminis]